MISPSKRVVIIRVALGIALIIGVFLVLAGLGVIPNSPVWLNVTGGIIALFSCFISLLTWLFANNGQMQEIRETSVEEKVNSIPALPDVRKRFIQDQKNTINPTLFNGKIVAFAESRFVGHKIHATPRITWEQYPDKRDQLSETKEALIQSKRVDSEFIYVACFNNLPPGDYMIWEDIYQPIPVPLGENDINWVNL
ncbi:hypothetical protein KSF_089400 [Reticulibacter mediterranei]|uniref:Uncharacterized protein n=1 Tax=Reticulibacter mediterranei TaxID=2778369 RepID=A0A8J3IY29_9CHLR|nr:hypothetical protein [Reticulibacter mediterranei]GHO98892.1 hypothetical protein KSF_089400 [Reticulibacter mediterranei]